MMLKVCDSRVFSMISQDVTFTFISLGNIKTSKHMPQKFKILLSAVLLFFSCNVNDCDYYCDSGPLSLSFDLLDKESGENLFSNGVYQIDDVTVMDLNNENTLIAFGFSIENNLNQLVLGPFGFETKKANYAIAINSQTIFSFSLKTEEIKSTCCSTIALEEFNLLGADFKQNENTGTYEVLINF